MTFLYFGWLLITSTLTTIVLSPVSETTTPRRSWRRPSSLSGFGRRTIALRVAGFSRTSFVRERRSERGTWRCDFDGLVGAAGAASPTGASAGVSDTTSAVA